MYFSRLIGAGLIVVLGATLSGCSPIKNSIAGSLPPTVGRTLSSVAGDTGPLSGGTLVAPSEKVDVSAGRLGKLSPPISTVPAAKTRPVDVPRSAAPNLQALSTGTLHPALAPPGKAVSVDEGTLATKTVMSTKRSSKTAQFGAVILAPWAYDLAGASDGNYIVGLQGTGIYRTNGQFVQSFDPKSQIYCNPVNPLPVCTQGGPGDDRIFYDPGSARWIMTALWIGQDTTRYPARPVVLAVSQTSDPTGQWYAYNMSVCGDTDTTDTSDQPHTGFNANWIAIDSLCDTRYLGPNDGGLIAVNKSAAYAGQLAYTRFQDRIYENPGATANNPASTYSANESRLILTSTAVDPDYTVHLMTSYIGGTAASPAYYMGGWKSTTPAFTTGSDPGGCPILYSTFCVSAPGGGLIGNFTDTFSHSSGVYSSTFGDPYLVATMTFTDPRFTHASQIISFVVNTWSGGWNSLQVAGGTNGSGPIASDIAMPLVLSGANTALIGYEISRADYYPSAKIATWNIDTMTVTGSAFVQQGTGMPDSFATGRWSDFLTAISPIPGTSQFFIGGTASVPNGTNPQDSVWTTVTP